MRLLSKNKYAKISEIVRIVKERFLTKVGFFLSKPNKGSVTTNDNMNIEEYICGKSSITIEYFSVIMTGIAINMEVNTMCKINMSKKNEFSFLSQINCFRLYLNCFF